MSARSGEVDEAAVADLIRSAWAAVETSRVPDTMKEVAFSEVLRALLTSAVIGAVGPSSDTAYKGDDSVHVASEAPRRSEAQVLKLVSDETGVSVDRLEAVVNVDGDTVKLLGQHSKYGTATAEQARTIAQIVTVVRKLGMGANDTPFEIIKAACQSKHCYDPKNFASAHLPRIEGFVVKGEGSGRRLEARGPGIAAFPALIDRIQGEA